MDATTAAQNALQCVLEGKKGEAITIFCDDSRAQVGEAFEQGALKLGLETSRVVLPTDAKTMRTEITPDLTPYLTGKHANIYINLLRGIHEETPFRIKLIHAETADGKTRLGHCPGVTLDMLINGALALTAEEHRQMQTFATNLMEKLQTAQKIKITTPAGTHLTLSVQNRPFFTDTMMDWKLMKWMNLPTGEVIVAPVEDSLKGTLVADVAVGGIGPLKAPVEVAVKKGRAQTILCDDPEVLQRIGNSLNTDAMAGVVGEFAFGINPKARLVEEFLETEKMQGTVHIAFGDNSDMPGGENHSGNHMDLMMAHPTVDAVSADGTVVRVLENGSF
jgi:leucyl aminopeptidase (aminopeptidase T)